MNQNDPQQKDDREYMLGILPNGGPSKVDDYNEKIIFIFTVVIQYSCLFVKIVDEYIPEVSIIHTGKNNDGLKIKK